jgi:hypothetical protein
MSMSDQVYYLAVMGAEILLPLIPAFILFWAIPSDASVSGPFKGLKLKLGGAFAGYFVLFIALQTFFPAPERPQGELRYQVWHLRGQATLEGRDKLLASDISVQPVVDVIPGGSFRLDIPVPMNEAGALEFPTLVVDHPPCHASSSIDLNLTEQSGFGGTSTHVVIFKNPKERTIRVDGIHLPLDPSSVASDGKTKCKP